jgi:hypothetical protein
MMNYSKPYMKIYEKNKMGESFWGGGMGGGGYY